MKNPFKRAEKTLPQIVDDVIEAYEPLQFDIPRLLRGQHLADAIYGIDENSNGSEEKYSEWLVWVVNAFDQANTDGAVQTLKKGGFDLKRKINVLRNFLNKNGKKTMLDEKEAEPKMSF